MTKMVDTRTDDLVNPSHIDILSAESEQVKRALPLLLSAMKAFVSLKASKKKGAAEAQENRWDTVCVCVCVCVIRQVVLAGA